MDNTQHGFRSKNSVIIAAGSFIESIIESIDGGNMRRHFYGSV